MANHLRHLAQGVLDHGLLDPERLADGAGAIQSLVTDLDLREADDSAPLRDIGDADTPEADGHEESGLEAEDLLVPVAHLLLREGLGVEDREHGAVAAVDLADDLVHISPPVC